MATLSVKLLEELVTCNICLNQYDERIRKPKFLQCSHTICLECFQVYEMFQMIKFLYIFNH